VFDGANEALFRALPFWGSLCVVGVVGAAVIHTFGPNAAFVRRRLWRRPPPRKPRPPL